MSVHGPDERDEPVRARIPADLDSADPMFAGLTPGQLLTLTVLASPVLLAWRVLAGQVPAPVLLGASIPVLAGALGLVLARRDGLSLARWLMAAVRHRTGSRIMRLNEDLTGGPQFGEDSEPARSHARIPPAPLVGVTDDGVVVHADGRHSALVACTMVTTALSTNQDDAILAAGMARWLNSLSGPIQIVVRARPADLAQMAIDLSGRAVRIANPALADLALQHAETLLDTYEADRPLRRTVLIACGGGVSTGPEQALANLKRLRNRFGHSGSEGWEAREILVSARASAEASSRAARTVGELQALGVRAEILDGPQIQQFLAEAWNPCLLNPAPMNSSEPPPSWTGQEELLEIDEDIDPEPRNQRFFAPIEPVANTEGRPQP